MCSSSELQCLQHGGRHCRPVCGHLLNACGPISSSVAWCAAQISACSIFIKCIGSRKSFSTCLTHYADSSPCSFRSWYICHGAYLHKKGATSKKLHERKHLAHAEMVNPRSNQTQFHRCMLHITCKNMYHRKYETRHRADLQRKKLKMPVSQSGPG